MKPQKCSHERGKIMTNKEYSIDNTIRTKFIDAIEDVVSEICGKCKTDYCWDCGLTGMEFSESLADTVISSLDSERIRMEGVENA